jgi:hypothetical protein
VVSEQAALDHFFFQCMSPTRSEYSKLGLELVSLEYNRSRIPKKPSMEEENKNDRAEDSINLLLEQALTRQSRCLRKMVKSARRLFLCS